MGVRGLTTFIAQHSSKYLKRHELHDTYLVIDGNNLASQLYKWHAKCYDCFGGDYDKYADTVRHFFSLLEECNIIPLIVLDGGYEDKKLKTVYSRVKNRINQTKVLNCITEGSMTVFPLFLRELFVEIAMNLGLKVVRCLVEADYDMACIARKLGCPLLSYDSDFFIFDVEYIPFNTVILNTVKSSSKDKYKYLDCQIYRVEYFLKAFGGLRKECVPLLGVLLGNDYIHVSIFRNFYKELKKSKRMGHSDQQRRIKSLIAWLQTETFESAVRKVLGRLKQVHRSKVSEQILSTANNYVCSESELLRYLDIENINCNTHTSAPININMDEIGDIETDSSDSSDESDCQDESSESDIDDLLANDEQSAHSESSVLTDYFEDRYKRCIYPASFIDIIIHRRHIFIPLIENYSEMPAHNISLPIFSAICRILSSDDRTVKCILRNEKGRMQNFELSKSLKSLPTLIELQEIKNSQSLKYISDVLEVDNTFLDMLNGFPCSWKLFILSIDYWIRKSSTKVNECFIYALLVGAIILKTVDKGIYKNEIKFLKKFHKKITHIKTNPVLINGNTDMTPKEVIDTITFNDGVMIMKEIISNFDMIIKLQRNPKLFDSNIVHAFAQFQSCAFYIKYLNALLNFPFEDYLISDFYSGTLIYNLSNNFLSRPQLSSYLQLLMKECPNIYNSFIVIKTYLMSHVVHLLTTNVVSKRKKKKKKKITQTEVEDEILISDEDDKLFDANNRYSILKVVDR